MEQPPNDINPLDLQRGGPLPEDEIRRKAIAHVAVERTNSPSLHDFGVKDPFHPDLEGMFTQQ